MIWLALAGSALAGGGGIFGAVSAGGGTSDASGFIARGVATNIAVGGYQGNYQNSFKYGQYWRYGLNARLSGNRVSADTVEVAVALGPTLTRGADLLKLGAFWSVSAGPYVFARSAAPFDTLDIAAEDLRWGVYARGSVGAAYNFNHSVGLTARMEFGLQMDDDRISSTRGIGLGLVFRLPLVRKAVEEEVEEPYVDPFDADL